MRSVRLLAPAVALTALVGACSSGSPAVRPADVAGFDAAGLLDVGAADSVRSIDAPGFEQPGEAGWLDPSAPVVVVADAGTARAYPLAILSLHQIVNDTFAARPIAVTFAPLCNASVVFDRRVGARTLTFGVSGKLYRADVVLYDRETTSLWPQIGGVAVRGEMKGARLTPIASTVVSFGEFRAEYPNGQVLQRPTAADYTVKPFAGYDRRSGPDPDVFHARVDPRRRAMQRVVGVALGHEARAYPYDALRAAGVVNDAIDGNRIAVFFSDDAASIYGTASSGGTGVYERNVKGQPLTFVARDDGFVDEETGSAWSVLGVASAGPLRGARLRPVLHLDAFWFAWAAFVPDTDIWASRDR